MYKIMLYLINIGGNIILACVGMPKSNDLCCGVKN